MLAIDLAALDAPPFTSGSRSRPDASISLRTRSMTEVGRSAPAFQARPLISGRESELAIAT